MCQELKLKDKECERLSQVRNQLEQELEELTASLFEVGNTDQPLCLYMEQFNTADMTDQNSQDGSFFYQQCKIETKTVDI